MSRFLRESKPKRKLHRKFKKERVGLSEAEMKKPLKKDPKKTKQETRTRYKLNPDSKIDRFLTSFASRHDIDLIITSADRAASSGLNARNHSGQAGRDLGRLANPELFGTDKWSAIDKTKRKKAKVKDMALEAAIVGLRVGDEEGTNEPHIHLDQRTGKPYFLKGVKGREGKGSGELAMHASMGVLMRAEAKESGDLPQMEKKLLSKPNKLPGKKRK